MHVHERRALQVNDCLERDEHAPCGGRVGNIRGKRGDFSSSSISRAIRFGPALCQFHSCGPSPAERLRPG